MEVAIGFLPPSCQVTVRVNWNVHNDDEEQWAPHLLICGGSNISYDVDLDLTIKTSCRGIFILSSRL